jgi:uncharacterized coiled-coil protein SlyX
LNKKLIKYESLFKLIDDLEQKLTDNKLIIEKYNEENNYLKNKLEKLAHIKNEND